ncbi:sugar phosphate permease [Pseudonocardia autotrophica]|uniref:Hexuronate transporter n=2 Tax=Pseudonocardia TaxID=1847 RepID=A0A1Y2MRW8_PSEAH|nr:Hexuronate transporter [Pseudonocardia autotrophica]TDN74623.1 sugar phosphate permease [Pseudonocardia autotrophica]BBG05394.1 MFS transporter [Pseudonocardia autotrophica]GEC26436.1 MFS transporter [Pseudonocardia saturnea]
MTRSRRRWLVLAVGVFAQTAACSFVYGMPFLVPLLRDSAGLSLAQVGAYVGAPTAGLLCTLVLWGAFADRYGERGVMSIGLVLCAIAVAAAALAPVRPGPALLVLLGLGGAGAASVFAASGRMVMGWFGAHERGAAMGIRQTAQPLGVALAGLTLPTLAGAVGPFRALLLPAVLCLVTAVLVAALAPNPPRAPLRPGAAPDRSPYRTPVLWRVHGASALLVVPQFAVASFATEYLVREQGWHVAAAGAFVAASQVAGAAGRIATGVWSDRVGSRLRPMRQVAAAAAVVLLLFALGDAVAGWLAVAMLAVGAVVTVAPNGLAFTSTAELAGPSWSGRALGVQNTGQNIVASMVPAALGALVGATGYGIGFALAALAPLAAIGVTPVSDERSSPTD